MEYELGYKNALERVQALIERKKIDCYNAVDMDTTHGETVTGILIQGASEFIAIVQAEIEKLKSSP